MLRFGGPVDINIHVTSEGEDDISWDDGENKVISV